MGKNLYLPPDASPERRAAHAAYVAASDRLAKYGDVAALAAYRKAESEYGAAMLAEDKVRRPKSYPKEPSDEEMAARKAQWEREEREPTPLPWRVVHGLQWDDKEGLVTIEGANEDTVADNAQFYPHAIKAADAELIVTRVNAHDALVAALEACIENIKDSAQEIAENGGVKFDHDATWPEGSSIALAYAALALARGGK
ncbi:hypothetical protein [Mesorhizobium sp.]|uniref:hypothetical protein n=1 Tax=Mesorhizobium sp. TaxID=1871066 RepID=UPI000FE9F805|nr:hypothetical protein [Mesorhizobium sp.]RWO20624.1 MAG: hypothetical protein EOS09_26240 [Mesorhizobium sp.]